MAASLLAFGANGAVLSGRQAINKSGQLRMLSQRVLKAYAQLGLGLMPNESMNLLSRSIMMANGNMVALRAQAVADPVKVSLAKAEKTWAALRDLASVSPSKTDARQLAKLGDDMLLESDHLTGLFETAVGTHTATVINLAGRQRMLSQKMARHYFFNAWGVADKTDKLAFDKARSDFSLALETLTAFPQNSESIKNRLVMLNNQWTFMSTAFSADKGSSYNPVDARHVATTSENMLDIADELTLLYENLKV